jgi:hypothetical protein
MTGGLPAPEPLRGKVATVHLLTAQVLSLKRPAKYKIPWGQSGHEPEQPIGRNMQTERW